MLFTTNISCNTTIPHHNGSSTNHTLNMTNCTYIHNSRIILCNTTSNQTIHINCTNHTKSHCNLTQVTHQKDRRGFYSGVNNTMTHYYRNTTNFTHPNATNATDMPRYLRKLRGWRGKDHHNHTNITNVTTGNCSLESTFLYFKTSYQCSNSTFSEGGHGYVPETDSGFQKR